MSILIRRYGLFFLACLLFLPMDLEAQNEIIVLDEIVAKVNGDVITKTDLDRELLLFKESLRESSQNPADLEAEFEKQKEQLLSSIIRNKVMLQRAEELGMSANVEADVAAYLENLREEAGIPSMEVLDQVLRERGSSLAEYRKTIRDRMIVDALLGQFVYSKITLLTPEIEAFYQEHQKEFTIPAEIDLSEIVFLTEGKDRAGVRARAEQALARLRSGESFEEVAKEMSEGPTAKKGGAIGTFKKGSMNERLEEAAFALEEGEFSEILEQEYGFQIVKVNRRSEAQVRPLEEVRPQIENALYRRKSQPLVKEFVEKLLEESYIWISPKYAAQFDVEEISSAAMKTG